MGLFKKAKEPNCNKEMEKAYTKAVEYGKSFDKNLDFSPESIKDIDEILQYYHEDLVRAKGSQEPVTEKQIWAMALWWGAYMGQTMRQNELKGYNWVNTGENGSFFPLLEKGETQIFPIDKVYKRLVNGPEDSVVSFYDVLAGMQAKGKL